jgi:hypothetical protein
MGENGGGGNCGVCQLQGNEESQEVMGWNRVCVSWRTGHHGRNLQRMIGKNKRMNLKEIGEISEQSMNVEGIRKCRMNRSNISPSSPENRPPIMVTRIDTMNQSRCPSLFPRARLKFHLNLAA